MIFNPKKEFLEQKEFANIHRDLVVSNHFRAAIEASLFEMIMSIPLSATPEERAAHCNQMIGARNFINHLLNIAEMPKTPPTPPSANLNHLTK